MINLLKKIQSLFITPKNSVDIDSNSISTSESIESNIELIGRERLTQAIQLEEEDDNKELHKAITYTFLSTIFIIFGMWLTPIRKVVRANGQIKPFGSVNVIQHKEGGIVEAVHVKNGDLVKKDDIIVTLSSKDATVDIAAVSAQLDSLILKQSQLNALIDGKNLRIQDSQESFKNQKLIRSQQEVLESKRINIRNAINELNVIVQEKEAKVSGLRRKIDFEEDEVRTWKALVENGAASRIKLNDVLKNLTMTKSDYEEANAQLNQERIRLSKLEETLNLEAKTELAEAISEEAVVTENIRKLALRLDRTKIRAPETGLITDLKYQSTGSVIIPGSNVATIVPSGRKNIAEIKVLSKDIGFVKSSQNVDVKVLPYDPSIYGSLNGKILNISGSSTQDPADGQFYYLTTVALDSQEISKGAKEYPLQPGMPVQTDVLGDRINLLWYLASPVVRVFQ